MKHSIDDIKRWKSYGFVMTPVENKRPKGKTWRKDWSDEELLGAERLGFYQKDSNVFTIDFDDQGFVAHKYINMLPDTFTDGKKVNGKIIATHKTYKVNGVAPPKFKYPPKASKKDGLILETLTSKQTTFVGKGKHVIRDVPPTEIDVADLECRLKLISFMQEVEKNWVKVGTGQSDEAHLRLAAVLARLPEKQYSTELLQGFLEQLCHNVGDREIKNRINKIPYQREQLSKGVDEVYTIGELGKFLGNVNFKAHDLFKEKSEEETLWSYPCSTLNEFMTREYPPVDFIMEPLLTDRSFNLISGDYGSGKTMVGLKLALCIAAGKDFLDFRTRKPRPVLYVEAELPSSDIQSRIASLRFNEIEANINKTEVTPKDLQDSGYFNIVTKDDLVLAGIKNGFEYIAIADNDEKAKKGRQIILNTALKIFKRTGIFPCIFLDNFSILTAVDENKATDWQPLVHWFLDIKSRYGGAHSLFHHANKSSRKSASGSNFALRLADHHFMFFPQGENERFDMVGKCTQSKWIFDKRRHIPAEHQTFIFTCDEEGNWKKYPNLTQRDFTIIRELKEGKTSKQIAQDHKGDKGFGHSTIDRRIAELKKKGVIK